MTKIAFQYRLYLELYNPAFRVSASLGETVSQSFSIRATTVDQVDVPTKDEIVINSFFAIVDE